MQRLARWCFNHRRLVLLSWTCGLILVASISGIAGSSYDSDFNLPNTESKKALDALSASAPRNSGDSDTIVVHAKSGTLDDPATKSAVESMFQKVSTLPHVSSVGNFYGTTPGNGQVNNARTIGFVALQLDLSSQAIAADDVKTIIHAAQSIENDTIQVELGGEAIQFATGGAPGGNSSEFVGVFVAAIVLFFAFGSIYTMFLPLLTALLALGAGFSIIGLLTHAFDVASFGPTLGALIGLGVGIDYALFIVSRHRVNLQHGLSIEESAVTAVNTSGRAVLFAGITVCIGILGLLLLGVSFLYGLSLSVVVIVTMTMTMFAAMTFLPAMLGFVGMRALSKKQRAALALGAVESNDELSPGWHRWAMFIERRSLPLGLLALLVMCTLTIPAFSMRLGASDAGGDPKGSTTRHAYDLLSEGFGKGFNGPLQLVIKTNDVTKTNQLVANIKATDGVASVTPVSVIPGTDIAMANIYPSTSPQSKETTNLIDNLRSDVTHPYTTSTGVEVYIGGQTAVMHDFTNVLTDKLLLFIGAVIGLSFLLLMTVFRSLLIPLVASLMNLLSAGAAFGVVVAVFQWGWGASFFGIEQTGPIMAFLPIMAFAILFGLSMDYEVFLVSRMYEEWHKTGDNEEAIARGQTETGRVITAAATIMVVVFGSFVFGGESTIKLFGISLASAVLFDALIVRTVLVPALMHLFGKWNWYLPSVLDRVLPHLNVEAPKDESSLSA